MVIRIPRDKHIFEFGPKLKPAAYASPGDIVIFETYDCFAGQIKKETDLVTHIDFSRVNPATGPLYVKNAERGDALVVDILDIKVNDIGICVAVKGAGVLGDKVKNDKTRICKIENKIIKFLENIEIPIRPMIGVIGVAYDEEIPTGTPYKHGGNLDTKEITIGTRVFLPVFREGGLLAIGDLHAVQADGEICVAACEVSGEVMVKVQVLKGLAPEWPVLETNDAFYILVSDENVEKALREATDLAVKILQSSLNISWEDAYMLASLVVDIQISQLVDPKKTVRARIPKRILKDVTKVLSAIKSLL